MAKVTNTIPHEIILNLGDTHIYESHIEQVNRQLSRRMCKLPRLRVLKDLKTLKDIEALSFNEFELLNYHSYPGIKAEMAV